MNKIYIRTFGCQMAERDTEFIAGLFLDKGYKLADSPEDADIILFNTCSVRKHAEERAISNMGQLIKTEDRRPKTKDRKRKIYGIVGCMAQALKEKLFKRLPGLDIVCGTGEIAKLPELVEEARKNRILALENTDELLPELNPPYRQDRKYAYVSVMRGCDNFCSYCVVPYVRGRERSRKAEDVVREVKDLIKTGIRDITLLGQNVNSYKGPAYNFVQLLALINGIDGIGKIQFMTSHPKDATIELFEAMRDLDKVVKHLHLPLQSGSDRILELMNRGYMKKKYLNLVTKARDIISGLRLTTDIIVGFPTETEKDFNDTLDLIKEIRFNLAYIFKYSPRPETRASKMKDDVPERVKEKRHKILLDLQREISKRKTHEKVNSFCTG